MYSRVRKPGTLGVRAAPGAPAEETALISKGADDETIPGPWLASCVGLGCLRTRAGALPRLCPPDRLHQVGWARLAFLLVLGGLTVVGGGPCSRCGQLASA